ncbi:MAG: NAD(P)-dependent oxidoreductase [Calditrichia bacterium]
MDDSFINQQRAGIEYLNPIFQSRIKSQPLPAKYYSLKNKRILVTGAAGFIGGYLLRRLSEYGLDVTGSVLRPEEAGEMEALDFKSVVLDLADDGDWDSLLEGFDIVFNIAAMFQEVEFGEMLYDKVNHQGALKLAQTANRVGVKRFIHCSTVGVHGSVKEIPATENSPYNPMDLYHRTKLAGELAILNFAKGLPENGMIITVNRPAMVYGPGDVRMLKFFKAILSGRFRMIGSGNILAHLGYIEDQTESFLLCAVTAREKIHGEAFNIASGEPVTLNYFARTIADYAGVKLSGLHIPVAPVWLTALFFEIICKPLKIRPPLFRRRIGFFTHNRAFDLRKAKKHLGYESAWNLEDGIRETIKWYKKFNLVHIKSNQANDNYEKQSLNSSLEDSFKVERLK